MDDRPPPAGEVLDVFFAMIIMRVTQAFATFLQLSFFFASWTLSSSLFISRCSLHPVSASPRICRSSTLSSTTLSQLVPKLRLFPCTTMLHRCVPRSTTKYCMSLCPLCHASRHLSRTMFLLRTFSALPAATFVCTQCNVHAVAPKRHRQGSRSGVPPAWSLAGGELPCANIQYLGWLSKEGIVPFEHAKLRCEFCLQ